MIAESSRTKGLIDKDDIINYQYRILQQPTPQVKPNICNSHKYTSWHLQTKIKEIVADQPYSIRWIGNSPNAYLETYAYILLIGSGTSEASIIQFKHIIYELGRKCLDLPQQKLLVEFLCLIEYSRDRYSFLSKYPQIESILVKILQFIQKEDQSTQHLNSEGKNKAKVKRKALGKISSTDQNESGHLSSQQFQVELELQEVYQAFNSYFEFITILGSNEYCCTLKIFNERIVYIVIEKDCYFMLEVDKVSKVSIFPDQRANVISDFDKIMSSEQKISDEEFELQVNILKPRRNDFQVQESSVIAVQRASQIRKPHDKELKSTAKFAGFANFVPIQQPSEFQLASDERIEHDRTFIDQLLTATVVGQQNGTFKAFDSPKKNEKRGKILQKMKVIQEMKEALKAVRERLQKKIKVIDQLEHLKTQVALKIMQKNTPQMSECGENKHTTNRRSRQISKHNPVNLLKKDRKISYNEPTVFPKIQIQQALEARGSFRDAPAIFEKVFSEKPSARLGSKAGSLQCETNIKKRVYQSPGFDGHLSPPQSNLNVNVNLSINETLFRPYVTTSNSPSVKVSKFPCAKGGYPFYVPLQSKFPQSTGYIRMNLQSFPSRPINPETSIKIVKSS